MIKVLIADDIMILRQGLKAVLEQDPGLEVVALAENGREAFEKSKVFRPDVVLMDMRMPGYDGAYGIAAIKEHLPEVKVLVLTTFDDEETIQKALRSRGRLYSEGDGGCRGDRRSEKRVFRRQCVWRRCVSYHAQANGGGAPEACPVP